MNPSVASGHFVSDTQRNCCRVAKLVQPLRLVNDTSFHPQCTVGLQSQEVIVMYVLAVMADLAFAGEHLLLASTSFGVIAVDLRSPAPRRAQPQFAADASLTSVSRSHVSPVLVHLSVDSTVTGPTGLRACKLFWHC